MHTNQDTRISSMDCRFFRRHHVAFVDDTLPGVELVAMERHRIECAACAQLDAMVRRSLLLAHNLPSIECSADFGARLAQRLEQVRRDQLPLHRESPLARRPGLGTFLLAASVVMAAGASALALSGEGVQPDPMLPPVLASAPPPTVTAFSSPAVVATASAGIPLWPALFLADELPMRMAQDGFFTQVGLRAP